MARTLQVNDVEVKCGKEFPRVKSLSDDKMLWESRLRDGAVTISILWEGSRGFGEGLWRREGRMSKGESQGEERPQLK